MGITTREIATDHAVAMTALQLENAAVLAVSQGGMIAQFLTIDHPELVSKLVLAVTTPEADETLKSVVSSWMHMARAGDYGSLVIDTMEKTYSRAYCKRMCSLYPILSRIGKPRSFDRFLAQAGACVEHSVTSELSRITARMLCIGGGDDRVVGPGKTAAFWLDEVYAISITKIWRDVVESKTYVTGGVGSRHSGESSGNGLSCRTDAPMPKLAPQSVP